MSTFKNPVGPQSSSVYWRRRLIVGLGALVVILVIVLIVVRPGAGGSNTDPSSASETTPTATDDPTTDDAATDEAATDTPPAVAEGVCDPADISVVAKTDATTYAAGVSPMISLGVTNTGDTACLMNVGTDVQEYRVTSGEELIWSSKDCQQDPVALQQELQSGVPVDSTPFAWDRTRSDAASCDAERTQVTGEGASYHLTVLIDGVESEDTKQFVLN